MATFTPASRTLIYDNGALGFRNKIINGAMRIDQRNCATSMLLNNVDTYVIDRYTAFAINNKSFVPNTNTPTGTANVQQIKDAPPGFTYSLKYTVAAAKNILDDNDAYGLRQRIEGYNLLDLNYGYTSAKQATLSFWVKSSVAGIYTIAFRNHISTEFDIARAADEGTTYKAFQINAQYTTEYTINKNNTWQYVTITIPPNTQFLNNKDFNSGLGILWIVGAGKGQINPRFNIWTNDQNYTGLKTPKAFNTFMQTTGNTFQITGIQFENGAAATPFEYHSLGTELQYCQRYFSKTYNFVDKPGTITKSNAITSQSTEPVQPVLDMLPWNYPITMRTTPTIAAFSPATGASPYFHAYDGITAADYQVSTYNDVGDQRVPSFNVVTNITTTGTVNVHYGVHFTADAEI